MPKDTELKPCPFCGNEVEIEEGWSFTLLYCKNCGALVNFRGSGDKDRTVKAWNRRVGNENTKSCNDEHKS